ncbi:glycosyltransferase family protein [Aquirufa rosea]|uniref:Glycosyltransferase n=1 Tax=Aquirufa rosea TaxID=2509241 RepID=A0A4Q1BYV6_9BACT|nr:hypothetical protein [Aquirufa rosea]RXK48273.1 hypothetical protein ESB04_09525 [Aquirufa rosea]
MENEKGIQFFHLYRKDLINFFKKGVKKKIINVNKIEATWLPISNSCFEHISPGFIKNLFSVYLPNLLFIIFKKPVIKKIESAKPDIIHLNSVVLLPLVQYILESESLKTCKIILHVRELVNLENIFIFKSSLNHISRFVCIDYAVASRIMNSGLEIDQNKLFIQQNPFEAQTKLRPDLNKYFNSEKIIFSIAGVIGKDKGVEFVCESFFKSKIENVELLIIGKINNYATIIQEKYKNNNNIIWTDEIDSLFDSGAFSYINCLIRGENQFCTGRTVYESLFSGGMVLLPGYEKDLQNDYFLKKFSNQVFFYNPRNFESFNFELKKIVKLIKKNGVFNKRIAKSNYDEYAQFFINFYKELQFL